MTGAVARRPRGWPVLAARLDALTLRERAMAFLIALSLLVVAWHYLLFAPLDARRASLLAQLPGLEAGIASLNTHAARLAVERGADPDAGPRARLDALRAELARLDAQLVDLTGRLVPPRRMAAMLESVLSRETDMQLLRLAGLGVERVRVPVTDTAATGTGQSVAVARAGARAASTRSAVAEAGTPPPAEGEDTGPGLFRHGLVVEFEGSYLATLAYLRALESSRSRFLWEGLAFDVERYPVARVAITVYSLSLDDAWIGI